MAGNVYALLVGINDYSPAVGKLTGCLNDVDQFHDYLTDTFDTGVLHAEVLKDSDATRGNIIEQFRNHLGRATTGDTVVFQYCGHGAQSKSAKLFEQLYPDGKDEGLVCYDSREAGGFDLADKELAVLLAELAGNDPHIAVILDCCHSGSATRSADDFAQLKVRQTHARYDERPLESYIDGYYASLVGQGQALEIPVSRHISLAACERVQKAYETDSWVRHGVFSHSLLGVLGETGSDIAYADLFVRCRAKVRKLADKQEPQFETYRGFNAYGGFLGSRTTKASRRYSVYFDKRDGWQLDCGAVHGLPNDPDKRVELALYPESDGSQLAGHAATTQVGAQKSALELVDFSADESARFEAEVTSLPVPPLPIYVDGEEAGKKSLLEFWNELDGRSSGAELVDDPEGAPYVLTAADGRYLLTARETGKLIQGAAGYTKAAARYLLDIVRRVANWERMIGLRNDSTRMSTDDVGYRFYEVLDGDEPHRFEGSDVTIDIVRDAGEWQDVRAALKATNGTRQPLHFMLVSFTEDYGFRAIYNERMEPTASEFPVTPNPTFTLGLDDDEGDQVTHTFKLIVSTEKVDDFLLQQDALELGAIYAPRTSRSADFGDGGDEPRKKLVHRNEWFTKDIHVRLIRQLDRVTDKGTAIGNGKIRIKGHPSLEAGIGLGAAKTTTRGVGSGSDIYRALERQGMELLNFGRTRGDNESVLELTDIRNPEVLAGNPLEIELDVPLAEDELILPLAFDGEHILLTGDPRRNESGHAEISISEIPDIPDNRRSLGKALKLYFFKTWLRRDNVNKLCRVEYRDDGTVERRPDGVREKVAAAKNVLLLIHGIIGDTQGMAEGMRLAQDAAGRGLNEKFDLVLTYDYENLSTPISDTAVALKAQLREAGFDDGDDKRLTLLVHSMGGLVSRWLIEREGGNRFVDHLVMCGTPNVGSPFGKVNGARHLTQMLTTLAINSFPAFAPFGGALIYALNQSKKLTPCLEQMNPDSDFIRALNVSDDPGVPYTIVAADARAYEETSDEIAASLIAKLGRGPVFDALYQDAAHDIAVSDDSILGVPEGRQPAADKHSIVGHHLNYFVNAASLRTLSEVEW